MVLLRWFKGHQGSGNIQAEIDLSRKLAIEAAKQLKLVNDSTEESAQMETVDLSKFMEETKSADTLAYDYALELAHLAASEMSKQGLTKKELTERMGVSPQRLANLLNTQPNMTLKSVAQLALALDIRVEFSSKPAFSSETQYKCAESDESK